MSNTSCGEDGVVEALPAPARRDPDRGAARAPRWRPSERRRLELGAGLDRRRRARRRTRRSSPQSVDEEPDPRAAARDVPELVLGHLRELDEPGRVDRRRARSRAPSRDSSRAGAEGVPRGRVGGHRVEQQGQQLLGLQRRGGRAGIAATSVQPTASAWPRSSRVMRRARYGSAQVRPNGYGYVRRTRRGCSRSRRSRVAGSSTRGSRRTGSIPVQSSSPAPGDRQQPVGRAGGSASRPPPRSRCAPPRPRRRGSAAAPAARRAAREELAPSCARCRSRRTPRPCGRRRRAPSSAAPRRARAPRRPAKTSVTTGPWTEGGRRARRPRRAAHADRLGAHARTASTRPRWR